MTPAKLNSTAKKNSEDTKMSSTTLRRSKRNRAQAAMEEEIVSKRSRNDTNGENHSMEEQTPGPSQISSTPSTSKSPITGWEEEYASMYFLPIVKKIAEKLSAMKMKNTLVIQKIIDVVERRRFQSPTKVFDAIGKVVNDSANVKKNGREPSILKKMVAEELQELAERFGLCCALPQSNHMSQCSKCRKLCHHCCTGYNQELRRPRKNICSKCLPISVETAEMDSKSARSLPRTATTDYIEKVAKEEMMAYKQRWDARNTAAGTSGISSSDGEAPDIFVRLASSQNEELNFVRNNLDGQSAPNQKVEVNVKFQKRMFLVFQILDGEELILFGFETQEYGEENPPSNRKLAYLAYLEGVKHGVKTIGYNVFRSVLLAYFSWARDHGFERGHIWSSLSPQNTHFLFCDSPSDAMTQKDLNAWYIKLMEEMYQRQLLPSPYSPKMSCTSWHELPHCEGGLFTLETKNEDCCTTLERLNAYLKANANDVFIFDLNNPKNFKFEDEERRSQLMGNREKFVEKCQQLGWFFGTVKQARHSTKCIVECLHEELI